MRKRTCAAANLRAALLLMVAGLVSGLNLGAHAQPPTNLLAPPEEKPIRGMSYPALSPDARTLCFTYLGDLWTVAVTGGVAARITVHESLDAMPHWSPDGRFIAFSSLRNGNYDIFLIPAQGGAARQVTFSSSNDTVCDWSPDGTKLLFAAARDTRNPALWTIDLRNRAVKKVASDVEPLQFANWSPDGKSIVYTRSGIGWSRPWYRGSVAAQTVVNELGTGKVRTLLRSKEQQYWPLFAPDSKSVYVATIHDTGNTPNLWRLPVDGGKPQQITKYTKDAVRFPALSHDGSLLCYVYEGDIYTAKPDGSNPTKVTALARSDDKTNNQERATLTQGATESELSPDGKTLALVLRGDVWTVPSSGGDAKRLTDDPANDNDLAWSPDGTKIAFVSDRGNQPDLYLLDVKTKAATRLTNDGDTESGTQFSPDGRFITFAKNGSTPGLYLVSTTGGAARKIADGNGNNNFGTGIPGHTWSPDSKWITFARMDRFSNTDVWVVPSVGGAPINVTRYPGENVQPVFTKDGRKLLFISDRNGTPLVYQVPLEIEDDAADDKDENGRPKPKPDRSKDVKIAFDDIHLRARLAMPGIGGVSEFAAHPDSQRIVAAVNGNFWVIPLQPGPFLQLTSPIEPGGNIRFTPDGNRFFYLGMNGTPRSLGLAPGTLSVVAFSAPFLVDRRAVYRQAFNEFSRRFGEGFYDAKMHGVVWKDLKRKYEPLLEGVGTPEEFAYFLSIMVGEVNSSHSEISANSRGGGPQTATLGVFFDDTYDGPALKVSSVMAKGPADKPSTRLLPGEYILSVDGTDVRMNEEYFTTLYDKAGKTVELLVNSKPIKDGARTVKLKPIIRAAWLDLDYEAWVRKNREMVDKLSSGRLAYIHVRGMDQPSLQRFLREAGGDALAKEGLILDIRDNGGGNTHDALLDVLSRKVYGYTQPRDGVRQSQPERALTKPIVLLIDENSYSDAEIFPAGFRALGLGKIVGVPTPGYVIGTYGGTLTDGTRFRLPSWGWYTQDGKNMENLGIPPDIYVENTAEDIAANRDRQVQTAVQTILNQLPSKPADADALADNSTGVSRSANTNPNGGSSQAPPPTTGKGKAGKP